MTVSEFTIDSQTKYFMVIGNPVSHSLSPVIHNAAFRQTGYNGVYLAARVTDVRRAVEGVRALGVSGASVTVPHKIAVMEYLDDLDPLAEKIGAVNTIVNRKGRLSGYNTDCTGAIEALQEIGDVSGKQVAVVGAGGAARAIGFGLTAAGAKVTIVNRSTPAGEALAEAIGGAFLPLSEQYELQCDILVNTTPVGMHPDVGRMPVHPATLKSGMTVMDIVYTPLETELIRSAKTAGLQTVDGLSMFLRQGAQQFQLWTGLDAPIAVMKAAALHRLIP